MKVQVLVDGVYNNLHHRAQHAKAGDLIDVAGGGYGLSLVRDGFVQPVVVAPAEMPAKEMPAEETLAEETLAEEMLAGETLAGETLAEETPVTSSEGTPAKPPKRGKRT